MTAAGPLQTTGRYPSSFQVAIGSNGKGRVVEWWQGALVLEPVGSVFGCLILISCVALGSLLNQ